VSSNGFSAAPGSSSSDRSRSASQRDQRTSFGLLRLTGEAEAREQRQREEQEARERFEREFEKYAEERARIEQEAEPAESLQSRPAKPRRRFRDLIRDDQQATP
jgi:hypothetical protein